jgi:hypothetical protein
MQINVKYIILLLIIWGGEMVAQGYSKVIETDGLNDYAWNMETHPDGGTVIASLIDCPDDSRFNQIVLHKTDINGDLEYTKSMDYCDSLSMEMQLQGALLRVDSFFYLLWFSWDTIKSVHLTKFDLDLNEVFTRSYEDEGYMLAWSIVKISPHRLVIAYSEYTPKEKGIERFIKIDLEGNEVDRGQVSYAHPLYKPIGKRFLRSVGLTKQKTLLISLETPEFWNPKHYLLEVDTSFNLVRDYHYENLEDFDNQYCTSNSGVIEISAPLPNGNFVVVNCRDTIELTWPPVMLAARHPRLIAYTPNGDKVWDSTFLSYAGYTINHLEVDNKGIIYGAGSVKRSDRSDETYGAFFLKMSQEGEVLWLRRVFPDFRLHDDADVLNINLLPDQGVMASGYLGYRENRSDIDIWLIRLDSNGCITSGCSGEDILLSTSEEDGIWQSLDQVPFIVYPNPTQGEVHLHTDFSPDSEDHLIWSDQVGRTVLRQSLLSDRLQTHEAPSRSGLYFLTLYRDGLPIHTEKVMVE